MFCWFRKKYTARVVAGVDGKHHVRIVAGNGEIVLASETYSRREDAERAARTLASVRIVFEE